MQKIQSIQRIKNEAMVSKGQKIVAALYLVTNHLSDSDPLKVAIRTAAILLIQKEHQLHTAEHITTLLGASVLAGIISEKNVSIISREIQLYGALHDTNQTFGSLFEPEVTSAYKRTENTPTMSFMSNSMSLKIKNNQLNLGNKNKRQNDILSFINERKSVGIKDIAALFTDVSEKTIQRELGALVATGKITKRGSKRWSIYMAIV